MSSRSVAVRRSRSVSSWLRRTTATLATTIFVAFVIVPLIWVAVLALLLFVLVPLAVLTAGWVLHRPLRAMAGWLDRQFSNTPANLKPGSVLLIQKRNPASD